MSEIETLSEPLLTKREVAQMIGGVSDGTVDKLRRKGVLTPIRIGHRTVRFRRSDVEAGLRTLEKPEAQAAG